MTQEQGVPLDFWGRVQRMIEDAVAKLARSGMLRNASISEGGSLTIKGGRLQVNFPAAEGGGLGVYFGDLYNESGGAYLGTGLLVQDQNGQDIAQFRTDAGTGRNVSVISDANGDNAVTTDRTAGFGLSRPFLANGFVPNRYNDWTISTTSATFETLFVSNGYRTHAGIMAWTRASMDAAGTTGEVRVLVNGVQLDTPDAIGFVQTLTFHGPAVLPGNSYDFLTVEIQGRVTSGSGALRVAGGGWLGRP